MVDRKASAQAVIEARAAWLAGRTCEDCGVNGPLIVVLKEYVPGKRIQHKFWRLPPDKREPYLQLRTAVCGACQRGRMAARGSQPTRRHGTFSMYNGPEKCRCGVCKTAAREYSRKWRAENPDKVAGYRANEVARLKNGG